MSNIDKDREGEHQSSDSGLQRGRPSVFVCERERLCLYLAGDMSLTRHLRIQKDK